MNVALLVLRVVVGALFVGHGCQKLCGWFGGRGLKGTASFFESVGLAPGLPLAVLAGLSELAGGLLLGFGLFVPVATLLLTGVMTTAIVAVHWRNGVWNQDGGFEFPLVLATVAFAVAAIGPGTISLDNWVGIDWSGLIWAVDALVLGAIGGLACYALGRIVGTQSASEKGGGSGTPPARTRGPVILRVVGVGVLAALAAMVAATMLAVAAVGIPFDGPIGDRTVRPATAFELEDAYEQSIGELTVDLSDLAPPGRHEGDPRERRRRPADDPCPRGCWGEGRRARDCWRGVRARRPRERLGRRRNGRRRGRRRRAAARHRCRRGARGARGAPRVSTFAATLSTAFARLGRRQDDGLAIGA